MDFFSWNELSVELSVIVIVVLSLMIVFSFYEFFFFGIEAVELLDERVNFGFKGSDVGGEDTDTINKRGDENVRDRDAHKIRRRGLGGGR